MTVEVATILAGVISGGVGGSLAVVGALWAVRRGIRDLEDVEIRRHRVTCITNLYALRHILGVRPPAPPPRAEDAAAFAFELNRAGLLFANNQRVLNDLRDFHDLITKNVDATPQLLALLKHMAEQTRLDVSGLSDADIRNVLNVSVPNLAPPANVAIR
jgi:hypothetical protein